MGYGTTFKTDVHLPHMVFRTKEQLLEQIEESENSISFIREKMLMLASSTPSDIYLREITDDIPKNEDLTSGIRELVDELFEWLGDEMSKLTKLYQFLELLEEYPEKDISEYYPFKNKTDE